MVYRTKQPDPLDHHHSHLEVNFGVMFMTLYAADAAGPWRFSNGLLAIACPKPLLAVTIADLPLRPKSMIPPSTEKRLGTTKQRRA